MSAECFQIDLADNVATLLQDAPEATDLAVRGDAATPVVRTLEPIRAEHKVAVVDIAAGQPILKYGFPIGVATQPIARGQWVHLHNCRSSYDALSSELDIESGSRTETPYV